jgi:hypothetical protein
VAITGNDAITYARRSALDRVGASADLDLVIVVNDAVDMLASEKSWPQYMRRAYLQVLAPYSTGTITLTAGSPTVTLASGTFPTWTAANVTAQLKNSSGLIFDVLTRDTSTQLTLNGSSGETTAAGQTYVLFFSEYTLPDNLYEFGELLAGRAWGGGEDFTPVPIEQLWVRQNDVAYSQDYPDVYAIHNGKIVFDPYPQMAATVAYTYFARPTPITSTSLTLTTENIDWPAAQAQILHRAIDVHVALRFGECIVGDFSKALAAYQAMLAKIPTQAQVGMRRVGSVLDLYGGPGRAPVWRRRN